MSTDGVELYASLVRDNGALALVDWTVGFVHAFFVLQCKLWKICRKPKQYAGL